MKASHITLFAALLILSSVWATQASAQGQVKGTRPLGMGSAFTANASGNGAIYHNPAGLSSILTLSMEGAYFINPDVQSLNVSVLDSKLNPKLAASAAYSYELSTRDDNNVTGHDARVALGSRLHPNLVLGIGGRYLDFSDGDTELFKGYTMDLGAIYKITQGLYLGVAGNNLLNICEGDTNNTCPSTAAPRVARGGLSFGSALGFQISADAQADFGSDPDKVQMIWAGGAEFLIQGLVALRAGYQHLQAPGQNVVTAGGGFKTINLGFDLGYSYNFDNEDYVFSAALQFSP